MHSCQHCWNNRVCEPIHHELEAIAEKMKMVALVAQTLTMATSTDNRWRVQPQLADAVTQLLSLYYDDNKYRNLLQLTGDTFYAHAEELGFKLIRMD